MTNLMMLLDWQKASQQEIVIAVGRPVNDVSYRLIVCNLKNLKEMLTFSRI